MISPSPSSSFMSSSSSMLFSPVGCIHIVVGCPYALQLHQLSYCLYQSVLYMLFRRTSLPTELAASLYQLVVHVFYTGHQLPCLLCLLFCARLVVYALFSCTSCLISWLHPYTSWLLPVLYQVGCLYAVELHKVALLPVLHLFCPSPFVCPGCTNYHTQQAAFS